MLLVFPGLAGASNQAPHPILPFQSMTCLEKFAFLFSDCATESYEFTKANINVDIFVRMTSSDACIDSYCPTFGLLLVPSKILNPDIDYDEFYSKHLRNLGMTRGEVGNGVIIQCRQNHPSYRMDVHQYGPVSVAPIWSSTIAPDCKEGFWPPWD
jgi:hypothetical protein